jgi:hypothetical protein
VLCYLSCQKFCFWFINCMLIVCKRVLVCGHFQVFPPVFNISLPDFSLFAETSQCLCRWVFVPYVPVLESRKYLITPAAVSMSPLCLYFLYCVCRIVSPIFFWMTMISFGGRYVQWILFRISWQRWSPMCFKNGLFICTGLYQLYIYIHYKY